MKLVLTNKFFPHADPKFGKPLVENEIKDFLSNSKLNIHIATIDEKGHPNIHPTYFDATKNKIYVETAKNDDSGEQPPPLIINRTFSNTLTLIKWTAYLL